MFRYITFGALFIASAVSAEQYQCKDAHRHFEGWAGEKGEIFKTNEEPRNKQDSLWVISADDYEDLILRTGENPSTFTRMSLSSDWLPGPLKKVVEEGDNITYAYALEGLYGYVMFNKKTLRLLKTVHINEGSSVALHTHFSICDPLPN